MITEDLCGPTGRDYGPTTSTAWLQFIPSGAGFGLNDGVVESHGFVAWRRTGVGIYEFELTNGRIEHGMVFTGVENKADYSWPYPSRNGHVVTITFVGPAGVPVDDDTALCNVMVRMRSDV